MLVFPAGTGGGNITARTTDTEHPAITSSDIGDFALGDPLPGRNVPPAALQHLRDQYTGGRHLGHICTKIVGT